MTRLPIINRVFNSTCSIGLLKKSVEEIKVKPSEAFLRIFGTGFCVRANTIITNRHVVLEMLKHQKDLGLPDKHRAAQFAYYRPNGGMQLHCVSLDKRMVVITDPDTDIALIEFKEATEGTLFQSSVKRLSIIETVDDLRLGEPVGVMGFPYGDFLHVDPRSESENISRLGPILQRGYISGFQPWHNTTAINDIFLDVRTIGGMSGSPVFRIRTGQVIGVLYGGIEQKLTVEGVEHTFPHAVLAKAVPIDWIRLGTWYAVLDSQEIGPGTSMSQY